MKILADPESKEIYVLCESPYRILAKVIIRENVILKIILEEPISDDEKRSVIIKEMNAFVKEKLKQLDFM